MGVLINVRRASKSYSDGLIEKRKDHQRELLAEFIANAGQWCDQLEITYMAMAKMTESDLIEYANTDSVRMLGEFAKATRFALVKCLSEVADDRIRPLLYQFEVQRQDSTKGDDAAPLFDHEASGGLRFEGLMVVLKRLWAMVRTCNDLQLAAIHALQVEISVVTRRRRFWDWFTGANIVVDAAIAKHY